MEYTVQVSGFEEAEPGFLKLRMLDVNAPIKEIAESMAKARAGRDGLRDAKVEGSWRREAFDVPVAANDI